MLELQMLHLLQLNLNHQYSILLLQAQIDSRPPVALKPSNRGRHFGDLQAAHHWSWIIPSSDLTTGKHQATIRVEEPGRPRQKFTHRFTS